MSSAAIAVDLGAESGRVIVGTLADGLLRLEEVHRFAHEAVWRGDGLFWDIEGMWREILRGLRQAAVWAEQAGVRLRSVGVDTWGVDWALVDASGELVAPPRAYRDPRNAAAFEKVLSTLGADRLYHTTGIQLMAINSLFSLYAHQLAAPEDLAKAERLLFLPDLFHYWLSGQMAVEATIASTSQMIDCHTGDWTFDLLAEIGLPARILTPTTPPGTRLGRLRPELVRETNLPDDLEVVLPASHDTASAIAAVPGEPGEPHNAGEPASAGGLPALPAGWCYLSSGTWSLLGAELASPCVSPEARAAMFTNELGVDGRTRFLKNIPGLWLVQQCRRDLARQGQEYDYAELTKLAADAPPFRTLLDPTDDSFAAPGDMLAKVAQFARQTGQPVPENLGQSVRAALESLALACRDKLNSLETILDHKFDVVHVVGGGGKNALLCQMTADATGRRVVVGPYEATAAGNTLVQMLATGTVASLAELRRIVARSFDLEMFEPVDSSEWNEAYTRFKLFG